MGVEIQVNRARCIATKACINAAPGVFQLDPCQVSSVKDPEGEDLDAVIEAAESCPTGAISVYRDGAKLA